MAIGGRAAKLEQLRLEARSRGREWLVSAMRDTKQDELRQLAQAAGLPLRRQNKAMMSTVELRDALVEHIVPARSAVPEEFAAELSELTMEKILFCLTHLEHGSKRKCPRLLWTSLCVYSSADLTAERNSIHLRIL